MGLMDDSARDVYRIRPVDVLDGRDTVKSYTDPAARTLASVIVQPSTGREDSNGNRDATLAQFSVISDANVPRRGVDVHDPRNENCLAAQCSVACLRRDAF